MKLKYHISAAVKRSTWREAILDRGHVGFPVASKVGPRSRILNHT